MSKDVKHDSDSGEYNEKVETAGQAPLILTAADIDVAALTAKDDVSIEFTPEQEARVRRKIDWHILPLMCIMSIMMLADQTVVAQSAILGVFQSTGMNFDQFNWLSSGLYFALLTFEYPQNLLLQRFPVAKWMSFCTFLWAVALLCHAACKSFWALLWARVALGAGLAVIMPGFMIVISMFYVHDEQSPRAGLWFMMGNLNSILLGFLAYGMLHTHTKNFMPWQWMMIITGLLTLIIAIVFWFWFPDSPATAWFLNDDERQIAIQRLKRNQTGIENKRWKKSQFIEALKDPKIYIFFFLGLFGNVPVSAYFQRQIIVNKFGFSVLETTLLGCVDGILGVLDILLAVWLASIPKIGRGYAAAIMYMIPLLGTILLNTLSFNNRIGLLFSYWLTVGTVGGFAIFLGWIPTLVGGHTKRITANAAFLIAANTGIAVGPFMWKERYQPRNRIPWIVIGVCYFSCGVLALVLRFLLVWENKKRDNSPRDTTYDEIYVTYEEDGKTVERRVDRAFLDLTDGENRDFRYPL